MNGELSGMNRELATVNFKKELKSSVSCLTSVPDQFYDLDIIGTNKAVKVLDDKIQDIIDIVQNIWIKAKTWNIDCWLLIVDSDMKHL